MASEWSKRASGARLFSCWEINECKCTDIFFPRSFWSTADTSLISALSNCLLKKKITQTKCCPTSLIADSPDSKSCLFQWGVSFSELHYTELRARWDTGLFRIRVLRWAESPWHGPGRKRMLQRELSAQHVTFPHTTPGDDSGPWNYLTAADRVRMIL